jgi:hypothetical protein
MRNSKLIVITRRLLTPDKIPGINIAAWFSTMESGSVILDGTTASQWSDISGNNRHATQATKANQPTYTPDGLNGKPVLTFDGVSDFFTMTSPVNESSVTLGCVYRLGSKHANAGSYLLGASTPLGILGYDDESRGMRILSDSGGYFNSPPPASVRLAASIDTIAISSNVATLYRSGTAIAGTVSLGANFQPTNIGTYVGGELGRFWSGIMSEIIICNPTLSTANRQQLEGYFAWRWGLQANLVNGHPFKFSPPYI